jgi:streptogramin lyase
MRQNTIGIIAGACLVASASAFTQNLPRFVSTWGSEGTGPGQFCGGMRIACGPTGRVYVADEGNQRVQVFDADGTLLMIWGRPGAADGNFSAPLGVAVDANGLVYVADTENYRVQKFDADGRFIKKWGSLCQVPQDGDCPGGFNGIFDIAVDASANAYLPEFYNHRVQKFDSEGNFLLKWGTHGTGPGQFDFPQSIAVDEHGNVYIGDNSRVQKFDGGGNFLLQWSGSYPGEFDTVIGLGTRDGIVYAVDRGGFQLFTCDGAFLTEWRDDDVPPPPVLGSSITFDPSENYVYTSGANRVLKFVFGPNRVESMTWSAVKQAYRGQPPQRQ